MLSFILDCDWSEPGKDSVQMIIKDNKILEIIFLKNES